MMEPVVLERVLERARQDFLARYVFKFLGTPLAGDDLVAHEDLDITRSLFQFMNVEQNSDRIADAQIVTLFGLGITGAAFWRIRNQDVMAVALQA